MKPRSINTTVLVLASLVAAVNLHIPCMAANYVINPSDDGSIYDNGSVVTSAYLLSAGYIRGVAEFRVSNITGEITAATLSVNPYGLPLWGRTVHVYGYASSDGILTSSDYSAGAFLGDWTLPDLGYGQDAYFDVASFLKGVTTPYAGFNLRSDGTDVFSSLEYNYGHPSQLRVTTVPEPVTLLLLGLGGMAMRRIRRA